MRDINDYREWYVSDSIEIRSTFFHLGVTDYGWVFNFLNAQTLYQQFVTIRLIPVISYRWSMEVSIPIFTLRSLLY